MEVFPSKEAQPEAFHLINSQRRCCFSRRSSKAFLDSQEILYQKGVTGSPSFFKKKEVSLSLKEGPSPLTSIKIIGRSSIEKKSSGDLNPLMGSFRSSYIYGSFVGSLLSVNELQEVVYQWKSLGFYFIYRRTFGSHIFINELLKNIISTGEL